jgi:hypothetical protein
MAGLPRSLVHAVAPAFASCASAAPPPTQKPVAAKVPSPCPPNTARPNICDDDVVDQDLDDEFRRHQGTGRLDW